MKNVVTHSSRGPSRSITEITTRAACKIQTRILGRLIGYFHTEIGELNQVVHLWGYESLAERERRRALLAADPEWQDYLKNSPDIIVKMESRILIPAPFSPIR